MVCISLGNCCVPCALSSGTQPALTSQRRAWSSSRQDQNFSQKSTSNPNAPTSANSGNAAFAAIRVYGGAPELRTSKKGSAAWGAAESNTPRVSVLPHLFALREASYSPPSSSLPIPRLLIVPVLLVVHGALRRPVQAVRGPLQLGLC